MAAMGPFVGRLDELARLDELESTAGAPNGLLLVGAAGVGKTRLLQEHLARLGANGAQPRLVTATGSSVSVPLGCLAELIAPRLLGNVPADSLFHEAVAALLADAAGAASWSLAIDDLPNVDEQSAGAMHQALITTGATFIATARTGQALPDAFDALRRAGQLHVVSIEPLQDRDIDALIGSAVDGDIEPGARLRLTRLSAGNPLALRELLASALETRSLRLEDGRWVLQDGFQTGVQVAALVDQRLAKIDPDLRHALELVALAEPLPVEVLWRHVDPSLTDALIERAFAALDPTGTALRCTHPLFAEVLRSQLPPGRRRRLCAWLLDSLPTDAGGPQLLRRARLALDAGVTSELDLLADAAKVARHVGDHDLARRCTDRVLAATSGSPHHRAVSFSATLTDALLRFEAGAPPATVFPAALERARTDEEVLGVITEWTWATLFTEGPHAAEQLIAAHTAAMPNRVARLWAEATAATVVGYVGRWGIARDRALTIAGQLEAGDPVRLQLTVRTLLAMAGGFDGPGAIALENGEAAQQLFEWRPVIPMTQAICGIVGRLYGVAQVHGFDAMAAEARALAHRSLTGDSYVDYAGVFPGVIGNNAVTFCALDQTARFDADEAVRLLRWRDPCGVLSLSIGAQGLFAALCGDLDRAAAVLDGYDDEFRSRESKTTALADRGRAWLAYQRGDVDGAVHWAHEAWASAWDRADVATWAAPAAHDLVRFGRPELAIDPLREAARRLDSALAAAMVAHAQAAVDADVAALERSAAAFRATGATGLSGEALLHAAALATGDDAERLTVEAAAVLRGSLLDTPLTRATAAHRRDHRSTPSGTAAWSAPTIRRTSGGWVVDHGDRTVTVRNLAGYGHLATLLAAPGTAIAASLLASGHRVDRPPPQPVLDERAGHELERRARAIVAELGRARSRSDTAAIARLEQEADAIASELRRSRRDGGTSRLFPDAEERARTAVQKAIKRAIEDLSGPAPELAEHLRRHVVTGTSCSYAPPR